MSIHAWSDEYISEFPEIDEQHKTFFKIINDFATENDKSVHAADILAFLTNLAKYADNHFRVEEALMERYGYPLLAHHRDAHRELKDTVAEVKSDVQRKQLKNPYANVIDLCTDWINEHIVREDMTFFNFCKNRGYDLGRNFAGRKCEMMTMDNKFLASGKIQSAKVNEVVIAGIAEKRVPVNLNDMVKVSSLSNERESQTFIAKVFFSVPGMIKLFNATVIQTENSRQDFRVPTKIEGTLWLDDKGFPVTINDVSAGGMRVSSGHAFEFGKTGKIAFTIQNVALEIPCKIVRATKKVGAPNTFGIRFATMTRTDAETVNAFVFNKQTQARRKNA